MNRHLFANASHTASRGGRRLQAAALLALAWLPAAWAAPVITSRLQVQAVVVVSGHESLKPVTTARPGDLLQYTAVYSNTGDAPAGHLLANLPIPTGTSLQAGDIQPAGALASVDGSQFAPMPLMRTVTGKDGQPHRVAVPLSEIRALRWDLGTLPAHQDKAVQARVRVNAPGTPTAAATTTGTTTTGTSTPR